MSAASPLARIRWREFSGRWREFSGCWREFSGRRRAAAGALAVACAAGAIAAGIPTGSQSATAAGTVEVIQTSANLAQHMTAQPGLSFAPGAVPSGIPIIGINAAARYQRVTGFGAAMTDSSAWLVEREPATVKDALLAELFGSQGLKLNFLRVPIGASDFTVGERPYTYDDVPRGESDPTLKHFSIAHDEPYILPALRAVVSLRPGIELLANPWSAPAWMKTNDRLDNAAGRGVLRLQAYRAFAAYLVKFLQAYAAAGVPIDAITPQNEPDQPVLYPGMTFPPAAEANWIIRDLRPALHRAGLHVAIYAIDRGWGRPDSVLAQHEVARIAGHDMTGTAWHCYFGSPDQMTTMHRDFPWLVQILDECSPGITPFPSAEVVIASLRDSASVVALWNLALDQSGGPVQAPNTGCPACRGLVKIDEPSGLITRGVDYYQLGQASSYIEPGAQRIASPHFVTYHYVVPHVNFISRGLDDVALRNPDGSIVLLTYNNATKPIRFAVVWHGQSFVYRLPAGAMTTFVWNQPAA